MNRYVFLFFMLSKVFFLRKFDIIHATTFSSIPTIFLVKIFRKPCLVTVSEIWGRDWFSYKLHPLLAFLGYLWEKLMLKLPFDKFIVPSNFTKKCFLQYNKNKDKVVVIKHGIDYNLFNPQKYNRTLIRKKYGIGDNFLFLFYGRFGVTKGLEYLLEAVPLIIKKIPRSKFI